MRRRYFLDMAAAEVLEYIELLPDLAQLLRQTTVDLIILVQRILSSVSFRVSILASFRVSKDAKHGGRCLAGNRVEAGSVGVKE